jgi:hypothetical protein
MCALPSSSFASIWTSSEESLASFYEFGQEKMMVSWRGLGRRLEVGH